MKGILGNFITALFTAIIVYTIVTNGSGSSKVITSSGGAVTGLVKAFTNPRGIGNNARR